jgi:GNAT superfamily N-acetyltransferase
MVSLAERASALPEFQQNTDSFHHRASDSVNIMDLEIRTIPMSDLDAHLRIPIAFTVTSIIEVSGPDQGLGGFVLTPRTVAQPYVKDYDDNSVDSPRNWARDFDLSTWALIAAFVDGRQIGGILLAHDSPAVHMLEGRRDLTMIWDIRVVPEFRQQGIGRRLFGAAETWARARACRLIKVETQNINVPACTFYARQGCTLGGINRFAYPELPEEVQMLWYKELSPP